MEGTQGSDIQVGVNPSRPTSSLSTRAALTLRAVFECCQADESPTRVSLANKLRRPLTDIEAGLGELQHAGLLQRAVVRLTMPGLVCAVRLPSLPEHAPQPVSIAPAANRAHGQGAAVIPLRASQPPRTPRSLQPATRATLPRTPHLRLVPSSNETR